MEDNAAAILRGKDVIYFKRQTHIFADHPPSEFFTQVQGSGDDNGTRSGLS